MGPGCWWERARARGEGDCQAGPACQQEGTLARLRQRRAGLSGAACGEGAGPWCGPCGGGDWAGRGERGRAREKGKSGLRGEGLGLVWVRVGFIFSISFLFLNNSNLFEFK